MFMIKKGLLITLVIVGKIIAIPIIVVYSDRIEHSAWRFRADLPPVQCMHSGKQSNPLICLIMEDHISKIVSMGHLCRQRPCY